MKKSKRIVSVFILLAISIIGASAQTQRQPYQTRDRQVGVILQRLERSSNRFRNSLNAVLIIVRVDQTTPQNDINTFRPNFERATAEFRDQLNRHLAGTAEVENILRHASLINSFMTRNRLSRQVQTDWTSVRTELNALANAYGIIWQWNRQTVISINPNPSSGRSHSELDQLIRRIDTGGDTFRSSLTDAFERSHYDQAGTENNMDNAVRSFKNATDQLRNQFDAGQPIIEFVNQLLARVPPIETYMHNNRLTDQVQNDWSTLRGDLSTLASAYNVSSNWQTGVSQAPNSSNRRLTGTFKLDPSRSDNPRAIADTATQGLSNNQRQEVSDRILARLESPEMLAIERRGSTMTMASSRAHQSTFEADGIERQEQLSNGRWSQITATLRGDQLGIRSTGFRENDFNVSFASIDNGDRLRVRREIYSDRLSPAVVVNSIYDRTSDVAQWSVFDGPGQGPDNTGANNGQFIVRDGETVVAVLNTDLTTERAKQGDPFTMTVRDSGQYEGATIGGTVNSVDQGGRLTGRSGMTLNFDTIRLRNGQTYRFAGVIESVRMVNGDTVRVDNEGSAQGDNQTTQTIQRGGIGTAIGAIIGAVAGGAKGAVIGGIIGATAGAGSVYVQGKDHLELPSGTELTVRASAPR